MAAVLPMLLAMGGVGVGAQGASPADAVVTAAEPERAALLIRAEAELARGNSASAIDDFQRAALMRHAADAELGTVRAALQLGRYREALAFCAHVAGEHLEASDAAALYTWLLRSGGQGGLAQQVLAAARARDPRDPVLMAVETAFAEPLPIPLGTLLMAPHRLAPWPTMLAGQAPVDSSAHVVAGAVLIGDGSLAVMPLAALESEAGGRLWVRNGLGQTTQVQGHPASAALAAHGIALLRLTAPLPLGMPATLAPGREPFAGSPAYAIQYAPTSEPAWPWLRQGFIGGVDAPTGLRRLGFEIDGRLPGAVVLDARGAVAGITLPAADGQALWLPARVWLGAASAGAAPSVAAALPVATSPSTPAQTAGRSALTAPDLVYEAGLAVALQVIADDQR